MARFPLAKFDMVRVVVVADAIDTLYSERFFQSKKKLSKLNKNRARKWGELSKQIR